MTRREQVTDGPETEVYRVPGNTSDGPTIYHRERDCDRLSESRRVQSKPLGVLFNDAQPCPWCHPELPTPTGGPDTPTLANTYPEGVDE